MNDLPKLLRVQRAAQSPPWRQEHAAVELGWRFHRYRQIAEALARPTPEEIARIAQVFGLSVRTVRAAAAATVVRRVDDGGKAASVA